MKFCVINFRTLTQILTGDILILVANELLSAKGVLNIVEIFYKTGKVGLFLSWKIDYLRLYNTGRCGKLSPNIQNNDVTLLLEVNKNSDYWFLVRIIKIPTKNRNFIFKRPMTKIPVLLSYKEKCPNWVWVNFFLNFCNSNFNVPSKELLLQPLFSGLQNNYNYYD